MLTRSRRLLQDLNVPPRNAAVAAALAFALVLGLVASLRPRAASAPDPARNLALSVAHVPPTAAIDPPGRRRFPSREVVAASRPAESGSRPASDGSGGWWVGTASVALALAAVGWVSVAARRYVAPGGPDPLALRVVGRASLSPKHSVYLVDVGGRVLILGAGPQGAPTLLGELPDPSPRFDQRLGDDS